MWDKAFAELTDPRLAKWALSLRASGSVKRLASTPQLATDLLATLNVVVRNLPSPGEPIGWFAARTTGDSLDDDRPLATLALRTAPCPLRSAGRQRRWMAARGVGIGRPDARRTVHHGHHSGPHWAPRSGDVARPTGTPRAAPARPRPPRLAQLDVFVCENPVVVAAAAGRLGPSYQPLMCTSGQPGAAVMYPLRLIVSAAFASRTCCTAVCPSPRGASTPRLSRRG